MSGRVGSITTEIITDGLVFNMDAANRACYPKTDTIATDTISSINGTLDGTTFNSSISGGTFNFDAVDDYISCGNSLPNSFTQLTVGVWASFSQTMLDNTSQYASVISKLGGSVNTDVFGIFKVNKRGDDSSNCVYFQANSGGSYIQTPFRISEGAFKMENAGVFHYLTGVYNGTTVEMYVNGVSYGTGAGTGTLNTNSNTLRIGYSTNYSRPFGGDIGNIHMYNRALSSTEVLHNYNALKGRFGLS